MFIIVVISLIFFIFRSSLSFLLGRGTVSSIHPQVRAVNKRSSLRQEEDGGGLEILGRAKTAQQGAGHPRLLNLGVLNKELVGHGGSDVLGHCQFISFAIRLQRGFLHRETAC